MLIHLQHAYLCCNDHITDNTMQCLDGEEARVEGYEVQRLVEE